VATRSTFRLYKSAVYFVGLIAVGSCIDRIDLDTPQVPPASLVVDGLITDAPGPYTVSLTHGIHLDDSRQFGEPVSAKSVTLFDSFGNSEVMQESKIGVYTTKSDGIRGVIGGEYRIRIEMKDGHVYESVPDQINPVGELDSVYFKFDLTPDARGIEQQGYKIFVNTHAPPGEENFIRWQFRGTYVVETLPQFHIESQCAYTPLPCSGWASVFGVLREGYAWNPVTFKYEYVIGLTCTCCRCWVTPRENRPIVESTKTHSDGQFNDLEIAYIPVDFYTFFEKYQVKVTQMSLSKNTYNFWQDIRAQRDGIESLFQPVTGKIQSNFLEDGVLSEVKGIFQACAIKTKIIYLDKNTHRVYVTVPQDCMRPPREGAMGENCLLGFPGSIVTNQEPEDWE